MIVYGMVLVRWLQYHTYSPNKHVHVYSGQLFPHYKIYIWKYRNMYILTYITKIQDRASKSGPACN